MNNTSAKSGSQTVTVTLKVHSEDIKSFRDPNQKGRKRYVLQVPVDEIAKAAIEFGPNPRNQDMGTSVVKAIQETLENEPGWFQYANKGILINAQEAEYDNKSSELRLSLHKDLKNPWGESLGGNMDGGHTQAVIIQRIKESWKNYEETGLKQWVNVEVLTGIDPDSLSFIAGARNRSVAVKDLALSVLNNEIDWLIQGEFEKAGFGNEIAWRQNANGDITGEEIIVYLSLLNSAITDKTRCYVGAGSIIKGLRTSPEQMAGLKDAATGKAVRWMKFIDYIHNSMESWWIAHKDGLGENASFGNLEGVTKVNQPHKLVFLRKEQDYRVAKSWLMPIAFGFTAAFKAEEDDNLLRKIAEKVGPKLMENIYDITLNEKRNMNAVGKNKSAWTSSEALVQAEYFAQKFAALTQQKGK